MATTSITEDFVTKSGLNVQGTSTVTSSTGQTGALQVDGGAAIAKNLIVGSTATVGNDLFVVDAATVGLSASIGQSLNVGTTATINGNLFVYGHSRIVTMTATGAVSILETTAATTGSTGALVVVGGAALGKNLVVLSTVSSTGTTFNNAVYVAGGVGIDKNLVVGGTSVFQGDVIFNGTATYVYSANTVYTDNILELHTPNTGTPGVWNADDGKDIGLRFHYYAGSNKNAALVLANDTKYLEWYESGAEGTDTFAGGTYGTFKTGNVLLTGTTNATTTQSGALQVTGGAGIGRDLYVGGAITAPLFIGTATTATNIAGGVTGSIPYQLSAGATALLSIGAPGNILFSNGTTPYWDTIGSITPDYANTATNIRYGAAMEIPFQTAAGITSFEYNLRYDYLADTLRTVNAVFTGTNNSSNTVSGALQVVGGVGIGGNIYVGQNAVINGTADVTGNTTITGNLAVNGTNTVLSGDLAVNGGDITTNQSTFNLLNTTATAINFASSATAITIGSSAGYTTIGTRTTITNTTAASSTITGALQVAGGVGIGGDIYVGGQTTVFGSIIPANGSINLGSLENPFAELFLSPNSLYVGNVVLSSTGSQLVVTSLVGPASLTIPTISVTSSTVSNSTNTGALTVSGGAGIGGALNVGGAVTINSTAASTGTNSGALVVAGGVGISGTLYINTTSYINNSEILTKETIRNFAVAAIIAGTDTAVSSSTGIVTIWNTSTLQSVTDRGNTTDHILVITNPTDASLTNSGALQVSGGASFGGNIVVGASATITNGLYVGDAATIANNLYIGGSTTVTNTLYVGGDIVTTATTFNLINTNATTVNFANSATTVNIGATTGVTTVRNDLTVVGNLIVHGVQTIVDSTVTNVSDPIITLGGGPNNNDLTLNDSKDRGIAFKYFNDQAKTGFFGYQNSTGYLTFFTSTTINNEIALPTVGTTKGAIDINLAGGTAQALVYQSSPDNTAFLAAGNTGYLLQSNGTALPPSWISPTTIVSNTATNLANGTAGQVPYQTAPGITSFYGPGTAGNVLVSNGNNAPTYNNTLTLTSTIVSTGTNTGALQVAGGVGIGGDLYVGGGEVILGNLEVRSGNITTNQTTFNLLNTTASTINFAGESTATTIGSATGYTAINNVTIVRNPTIATNTATGALQVVGGVGIGGDLYVGGTTYGTFSGNFAGTVTNIANGNTGSIPIQVAPGTTAFIPLGQSGALLVAGSTTATWQSALTLSVGNAVTATNANNLIGGDTGNIVIQSLSGTTTFIPLGQTGYVLTAGTNTATWTTSTSLSSGRATTATNLLNGTAGQVPYQVSPGITSFFGPGTSGNILTSNGTSAPAYQNTLTLSGTTGASSTTTGALQVVGGVGVGGNLYVGGTIFGTFNGSVSGAVTNIANGNAGSIPIQSSTSTTAFIPLGQIGALLVAGTNTATWTTATALTVGNATTATNISNGTAGQLLYQTSPGVTGFVNTGTIGNVLVSNGTGAPTYNNTLALSGTTSATSTLTGALTVAGGVGISGNLYVGGEIVAQRLTIQLTTVTTSYVTTDDVISTYNTTASTGTTTGALVVAGGAGVGGNIYAGDNIYSKGNLVVTTATINQYANQTIITAGTDTVVSTSTGNITIWNNSTLQSVTNRGATTLNKVQFLNTGSSTSTYALNSVYVQGGLYVNKDLTLLGSFNGVTATVTQVYGNSGQFFGDSYGFGALYAGIPSGFTQLPSTVLQLTGNIADYAQTNFQNLGTSPAASTDWVATANNGTNYEGFIDMGIASSQWDGSQQGSIGWAAGANDGYLYVAGGTGIGNGNLVLGSISTGSQVKINVGPPSTGSWTAVFNPANTISNSTSTGALILKGGLGVSGNIYAGGTIYGNFSGAVTNLAFGNTGSIPIQSSTGTTAFIPLGQNGYVLTVSGTTATWTSLTGLASGNATTATNIANGTAGQIPYQTAPGVTGFINTSNTGSILVSFGTSTPQYVNTTSITVGSSVTSTNLLSGATGSIAIQSSAGATAFIPLGQNGYILLAGSNTATWTTPAVLSVGSATTATNIAGGLVGQLHYQSAPGITNFVSTGTTGQLLVSQGTTSTGPVFVNTTSIIVGSAVTATNIAAGATGSIAIQSSAGTTSFIPLGTVGYVLVANSNTATWTTATSLSVSSAANSTTATNIAGGFAGQLHYQSAPGVTAFVSTATTGTVLVSNGTGAPAYQNTLTLAGISASISTNTGALQVAGGVGVGGSVYVGNRVGFVNTSNVSVVYQYYNAATNSLDTVFG